MSAPYVAGLTYLLQRAISGPQDVDNVQVLRLFCPNEKRFQTTNILLSNVAASKSIYLNNYYTIIITLFHVIKSIII